jgi:hypothetical protein
MEFSSSRCARVCVCLRRIIGGRHSSGNRPDTIGWNAIRRGPHIDCGSRGYFLHRSDTAWRQVCLYVSTYIYMVVSYRLREHIAIFFQYEGCGSGFIFVNHEASFIFMNHILLPFPFLPSSLSSVVVLVDVKVLCY